MPAIRVPEWVDRLQSRTEGAPPPSWYVHDLMQFVGQPYYGGLLTAAGIHGAAHQRPQEFQIVTDRPIRERTVGRARLRFFTSKFVSIAQVERRKTETGHMLVSSPEQTAVDLLRYHYACGHLSNVATVLGELADRIDPSRLVEVASGTERADAQRLGYLLTTLGHRESAAPLHAWLEEEGMSRVPLDPGGERDASLLDDDWRVYVNTVVEPQT